MGSMDKQSARDETGSDTASTHTAGIEGDKLPLHDALTSLHEALTSDDAAPLSSCAAITTSRRGGRGRGTSLNPQNRFEKLRYEPDPEAPPDQHPLPATEFFADRSQSILSTNDSPDIPFATSLNPYRGCEHGCAYCYARPTHEFLGFSAGLDFESRILVKIRAPELLHGEMAAPRWKPQVVAMSGVTDCYQPAERRFQITRRCLEVFLDFRNPVMIITKNHLVTRDIDLLKKLSAFRCAGVLISLTTLDSGLAHKLEPRTSSPEMRLDAIRQLRAAGVPVGVLIAPVIPTLNEPEIPALLEAAARAGASSASYALLRMPLGVKDLFVHWLEQHVPDRAATVLGRIRAMRGGRLNDPDFSSRLTGEGIYAEQIRNLFSICAQRAGLSHTAIELSVGHFRRPGEAEQLPLFEF